MTQSEVVNLLVKNSYFCNNSNEEEEKIALLKKDATVKNKPVTRPITDDYSFLKEGEKAFNVSIINEKRVAQKILVVSQKGIVSFYETSVETNQEAIRSNMNDSNYFRERLALPSKVLEGHMTIQKLNKFFMIANTSSSSANESQDVQEKSSPKPR